MNYTFQNGYLQITNFQITQQEFDYICKNKIITILRCNNCPSLTSLPNMPKLTRLYCYNCPLLTSLPDMPELTILWCHDCPLLTSLPDMPELTELGCYNCTLLSSLPDMPKLTMLNCISCPSLTSLPDEIEFANKIKTESEPCEKPCANPYVNKQTTKLEKEKQLFESIRKQQGLPIVSLFSEYLTTQEYNLTTQEYLNKTIHDKK
jgi:hypothetical protein